MHVRLVAIRFNHDPSSLSHDALNIRKNAYELVSVPEWLSGISVNPEDSPAVYAIKETSGNTITIQAQFRRTDPTIKTVEVRAVDPVLVQWRAGFGCLYEILTRLGVKFFVHPLEFANVLGEVKVREVEFQADGFTNSETFELVNERIGAKGVGIRAIEWQWQYRRSPTDPWENLAFTRHRIYTILETPKSPWVQTPQNARNVPWTEVLDYACRWATGTNSLDRAACAVTREVFNLGPDVMEYDCPGNGGPSYAFNEEFECSGFLGLLRGEPGWGRYVNCTDCATIVSTFSNILGCDLWQSRMGWNFGLNPALALGSDVWQTPCNWEHFRFHEVAWKGACSENDEVFDACLMVDGDADPTTSPHTPLLPCNMMFGNTGDGLYRDRLASPAGRPKCNPQPETRTRRDVY